jgi:hypothetical protein
MTDEQIEALVKKTAEETAHQVMRQTLLVLGVDTTDPLAFQADMQHLRAWRESIATVKRQGLLTAIVIIVAGVLGLIWTAVKAGSPPPTP